MLVNFYKLTCLIVVTAVCYVQVQANLNIKSNVEPHVIPYGPYHCYLRIVASCYDEMMINQGQDFTDAGLCSGVIKTGYFHLSPPINCDQDDLECWKTCNNTFKSELIKKNNGSDLSIPILYNVTYASYGSDFDPNKLNVSWSPVQGAQLYVVQYLNPIDTYSNWEVGSGRPIITSKTYTIFKKETLCSNYMFRVAAISINHVGQFSNIQASPDGYPKNFFLKLGLPEITYTNYSTANFEFPKNHGKKIAVRLTYNIPKADMLSDDLLVGKLYLRTKNDAYVELKRNSVWFNDRVIYHLLPMGFLNSGQEILFVRENFRDVCDREVKASTAVKIIFSCDKNVKTVPCRRRTYVDIMEKQSPWMAKTYKKRQVIRFEEPKETGGPAVLEKFKQQINMDDSKNICDIRMPSEEPNEFVMLENYRSVSFCSIFPPTDQTDEDKNKNNIDFMFPTKSDIIYTINIDKATLILLMKIAIVFLCVLIASALAGISYSHFKRGSNKSDHVFLKEKAEFA